MLRAYSADFCRLFLASSAPQRLCVSFFSSRPALFLSAFIRIIGAICVIGGCSSLSSLFLLSFSASLRLCVSFFLFGACSIPLSLHSPNRCNRRNLRIIFSTFSNVSLFSYFLFLFLLLRLSGSARASFFSRPVLFLSACIRKIGVICAICGLFFLQTRGSLCRCSCL